MHVTLLKAGLSGGPFKYYAGKEGEWVVLNSYNCLQVGWVGNSANTYQRDNKGFVNLVILSHKSEFLKRIKHSWNLVIFTWVISQFLLQWGKDYEKV